MIPRGQLNTQSHGDMSFLSIYSFIPTVGKKKRYLIDKIYCGTPVSIAEQIYLLCGQQPPHRFPSLNLGSAVPEILAHPPTRKLQLDKRIDVRSKGKKKRDGPYGVNRPVNFSASPANRTKHTCASSFDHGTSVSLIVLANPESLGIHRCVIALLFNLTRPSDS